jgi:hypothetical protein
MPLGKLKLTRRSGICQFVVYADISVIGGHKYYNEKNMNSISHYWPESKCQEQQVYGPLFFNGM